MEKKHWIIAGVIGVVSIAAAAAYIQYKRFTNYVISVGKIQIRSVSTKKIDFDIFLNFVNSSTLTFDIVEQEYEIFINTKYALKMKNKSSVKIFPSATSIIKINIVFDPNKVLGIIGKNFVDLLTNQQNIMVDVNIKLKVRFMGILISIPYLYKTTLKELMTPNPTTV